MYFLMKFESHSNKFHEGNMERIFEMEKYTYLKSFTNLIGKGFNLLNIKKLKRGRT